MTQRRMMVTKWGRWTATFIGFPLAGVAARSVVGAIDSPAAAVVGGLAGGAVLGAVQASIGGIERGDWVRWITTTAAGFAVGLGIGASLVDHRTDTASLVLMGAVCGAVVGVAQAASVPMRPLDRVMWAVATPVLWGAGWLISSQVIVDADRQHATFGSSGALVASMGAGVLFAVRRRPALPSTAAAGVRRATSGVSR